jgi:hypothetical protein
VQGEVDVAHQAQPLQRTLGRRHLGSVRRPLADSGI